MNSQAATGAARSAPGLTRGVNDEADARSERALVDRLRAGDDASYDRVVREYGGRMLAVARRYFGDESDAEDAVQDAFVSAFRAIDRFECTSRLGTWLHRIAVNACLMKLRSRRRRPERPIEDFLPGFLPDGHQRIPSHPWNAGASAGIEGEELRAMVRSKIEQLPESYREVLMLRDIEELDTDATAAALGITANAVKTRLHRARQALRGLLDPMFTEDHA